MEISFYKQHARAGHDCLLGGTIVAKKMLHQSRASAWCANVTYFTLGVRSVCKKNFQLDSKTYAMKVKL